MLLIIEKNISAGADVPVVGLYTGLLNT